MTALKQLSLPSLDDLLAERDRIVAEHAQELADIENQIAAAMRARGLSYSPPSPGKSTAKRTYHEQNRQEALKRGFVKEDGSADLERLRLERKAEKLRISVADVVKREASERAARAAAKFKTVKAGKR